MDKSRWGVFNSWDYPLLNKGISSNLNWDVFDRLFQTSEKCYELEKKEIFLLLDEWNIRLKDYGGDPTFYNWNKFRPLKLAREEDWSDWLGHLIDSSKTGYFSRNLFKTIGLGIADAHDIDFIEREPFHKGYRGDLLVKWKNGIFVLVEVKTGDPNLEKTYDTALIIREKYRAQYILWHNYILLLRNQVSQWLDIKEKETVKVEYLTWEKVAICLRRSLLFSDEPTSSWKAWAYMFIGAIEKILLNHPHIDIANKRISNNYALDSMSEILKEGMKNEE